MDHKQEQEAPASLPGTSPFLHDKAVCHLPPAVDWSASPPTLIILFALRF